MKEPDPQINSPEEIPARFAEARNERDAVKETNIITRGQMKSVDYRKTT